jgi:DNA-dependent RNA polymerase auxiliary subunit epsilon
MNNKREYCVGIKIINCFYVEAESREEAEQIVREYDPYKTLDDCDFNVEYVDPTNGEIAWKIKADEVNWSDLHNKHDNWLDKRIDDLYGDDPTIDLNNK